MNLSPLWVVLAIGCGGERREVVEEAVTVRADAGVVVDGGMEVLGIPQTVERLRAVPAEAGESGCEDEIAGTWMAMSFRPEYDDWIQHELRIARRADGELEVAQTARIYPGNAQGVTSLGCLPDWKQYEIVGKARRTGRRLRVWGTELRASRPRCDGMDDTYSLDNFSGTLDGDTFAAVNNDGNTARDRPYTFHRLPCPITRR